MNTSGNQSHLRFPLTRILGSPGNLRVLRALILAPGPIGAPRLAETVGLTPQGARHVLGVLVGLDVVSVAGSGRTQVYSPNQGHPLMETLRILFSAEAAKWERFRKKLRKVLDGQPAIHAAWYYGSVARGEDGPGSDFDLAVVVKKGVSVDKALAGLRARLWPIEDEFGVSCSVVGLAPGDVSRHAASDAGPGSWWISALRDAKLLKGAVPQQVATARERAAR